MGTHFSKATIGWSRTKQRVVRLTPCMHMLSMMYAIVQTMLTGDLSALRTSLNVLASVAVTAAGVSAKMRAMASSRCASLSILVLGGSLGHR